MQPISNPVWLWWRQMQQAALKKRRKKNNEEEEAVGSSLRMAANEISVDITNWFELDGIFTFKKKGGDEQHPNRKPCAVAT